LGDSAKGTVEITTGHTFSWEASDQHMKPGATPFGVAFALYRLVSNRACRFLGNGMRVNLRNGNTCQPRRLAVVSELPIKRLTRATRTGESALAAKQGPSAAVIT
jgi:hypothetical protein